MRKKVLWSGVAAALIAASPAYAECNQSDLTGRFRSFTATADSVTHCTIEVTAGGKLEAGTPCRLILPFVGGVNGSVRSGELSVGGGCNITGRVVIRGGGKTVTVNIESAQLNRDKNSASGVGRDSTGLVFMFSAQRI